MKLGDALSVQVMVTVDVTTPDGKQQTLNVPLSTIIPIACDGVGHFAVVEGSLKVHALV